MAWRTLRMVHGWPTLAPICQLDVARSMVPLYAALNAMSGNRGGDVATQLDVLKPKPFYPEGEKPAEKTKQFKLLPRPAMMSDDELDRLDPNRTKYERIYRR